MIFNNPKTSIFMENFFDTFKIMIIGAAGYLLSWMFGENWLTDNHAALNRWIQTFVLILTGIAVIIQFIWNAKKHKKDLNERRNSKKD